MTIDTAARRDTTTLAASPVAAVATTVAGMDQRHFLFLNIGHFLDHMLTLVYATVAALVLTREWGVSYAALVPYATPSFIAFGVFALPAGRLADRWSREGMMAVFFIGIGLASILTGFARNPIEIAAGLFLVGVFAAIYHPVGLALVVQAYAKTGMALAVNGVWGNLGVGSAALITGFFIDHGGWRSAFFVPGAISVAIGILYCWLYWDRIAVPIRPRPSAATSADASSGWRGPRSPERDLLIRLTVIVIATTALAGIIFQSASFSLPRVFDERLTGIAGSATVIGWLAFLVFAVASLAQLVVGVLLDRYGPRPVFMGAAAIQMVFFLLMIGQTDWLALAAAIGFMMGTFGQIPINDFMIGKMARSELRASIYGARYVISFVVLAASLPLIAWIYQGWGFDMLFRLMAMTALAIFAVAALLPRQLPQT